MRIICLNAVLARHSSNSQNRPLTVDVHHVIGSFLAGGAVQNVGDSLHGRVHNRAVRDRSAHDFQVLLRLQHPVMT